MILFMKIKILLTILIITIFFIVGCTASNPTFSDIKMKPNKYLNKEVTIEGIVVLNVESEFGKGNGFAKVFIVNSEEDSKLLHKAPHIYGLALFKDGEFIVCKESSNNDISCTEENIDNDHYTIQGFIRKAADRFYVEVTHMVKTNDLY